MCFSVCFRWCFPSKVVLMILSSAGFRLKEACPDVTSVVDVSVSSQLSLQLFQSFSDEDFTLSGKVF